MATNLVSIGECMVELAPSGGDDMYHLAFAGDTLNTAWYAAQLRPDWTVRFVSRVGQDAISDRMVGFLDRSGITTDRIQRSPDRSVGLYLIEVQNGERSFSYWRDQSAARQLADDPGGLAQALAEGDILYFSGITLAILPEAGRHTLIDVLAAARARGQCVAFDPNLRPRLWSDPGTMRAVVMRAAAISDIILPSHEDEAMHFGDADPQATRLRYLEAGASTVIVKNGGGPVDFHHDGQSGQVIPQEVADVVDTTAAGDSFNAALLTALGGPKPLQSILAAAGGVAAHVIRHPGALVPLEGHTL